MPLLHPSAVCRPRKEVQWGRQGYVQALLCCREEERESCVLETDRAPGITFDGRLAIWSPSQRLGWQRGWLETQHPWQRARAPPAPLGAVGVPAAQVPTPPGVRSPGWSLLAGTEVRLVMGGTLLWAVSQGEIPPPHPPRSRFCFPAPTGLMV